MPDVASHLSLAARHGHHLTEYHQWQGESNDCGPHVVAMAINFWRGDHSLEPDAVARAMNRPRLGLGLPPIVIRRVPRWATFPWGIADMLRAHDIPARWRFRASEEDLHRALAEGRLVMPIYGEPLRRKGWRWRGWSHVALLTGWDAAAETYYFVDSSRRSAPSTRSRADFLRLWGNLSRLVVISE